MQLLARVWTPLVFSTVNVHIEGMALTLCKKEKKKKNKEFIYRYLSKAKAIVTSRSRVLGFGLVTQSIKVRWRLMSHYNPSFQLFSDLVLLRGGQVAAEIQTPKGFLWDAVVHDSFLTCYATAFSW
jgi:hypothetical protein